MKNKFILTLMSVTLISCGKPYCTFTEEEKKDIVSDAGSYGSQFALKKHNIDKPCLEKLKSESYTDGNVKYEKPNQSKDTSPQDLDNMNFNSQNSGSAWDYIQQYAIAKRNDDFMQMYQQASLAEISFLNQKNETAYRFWHKIKIDIGRKIGLRY